MAMFLSKEVQLILWPSTYIFQTKESCALTSLKEHPIFANTLNTLNNGISDRHFVILTSTSLQIRSWLPLRFFFPPLSL